MLGLCGIYSLKYLHIPPSYSIHLTKCNLKSFSNAGFEDHNTNSHDARKIISKIVFYKAHKSNCWTMSSSFFLISYIDILMGKLQWVFGSEFLLCPNGQVKNCAFKSSWLFALQELFIAANGSIVVCLNSSQFELLLSNLQA